ncbi:GreA/GreB family elongation factor [Faecalibacter bovis]|uniref:GreA/GreB family elongation factor n=1 Tax=Faecalibacter bovis TaxID=2898187 RepID=A0ABX7XAS9_9FLAO|nr:GreA/GreB family elongation factor [Faecalibacter bovis]QTV04998.1 GreA/GreB family elongation factor [Faecalibacter bovis]
MSTKLILTTGIYDLIKDHLRRKKVTKSQEVILTEGLRNAKQVLRRDLPKDIVSVNNILRVKDVSTNDEIEVKLVAPDKAKFKKDKYSILSNLGLATVGKAVGETVEWPTATEIKTYQILATLPID